MGKTNQERIRRKIAQAYRNMSRVVDDLAPIAELFEGPHPDMAEGLKVICVSQEIAQGLLENFCRAAWGRIPENWDAWRNPATEQREDLDGNADGGNVPYDS